MEYRDFLASVQPVYIALDQSSCSVNRAAYWSQPKDARRVLSSRYVLSDVSPDFFDVQAVFSAGIEWASPDGVVVHAVKIDCVFVGHFHTTERVEEEHAKKFAEAESWLMFWPFFRQFVVDTTARMSIPPILIPLALRPGEHSQALDKSRRPKRVARPKVATSGKA